MSTNSLPLTHKALNFYPPLYQFLTLDTSCTVESHSRAITVRRQPHEEPPTRKAPILCRVLITLVILYQDYGYSETSLIRHLYNPTFSLIRPLYEVQSPYIIYGNRHSIIQQPPNPTLFSGPIECQIREVSLYLSINTESS